MTPPTITLGLEEELQVVDQITAELVAHDLAAGQRDFPDAHGTSSGEIHRCVLEVQTPVCPSPDEVIRCLAHLRRMARDRAHVQGHQVLAAGMHPFSPWRDQAVRSDLLDHPHYVHMLHEYGDLGRSLLVFGTHVHLGVESAHRAYVFNGLREVLPEVLALSVSSPYHEGHDTGLASWRHSVLDRLPRMGIPDAVTNEPAYWAHVQLLRATRCLEPDQSVWGDIRIHQRYGTLEVRICDAMPRLATNWLVVALLQAEAWTLVHESQQGLFQLPLPREYINENKWRARRHGTQARMVHWGDHIELSFADRMAQWLRRLAPAAQALGFEARLQAEVAHLIALGDNAREQRERYAQTHNLRDVVRQLVQLTAQPDEPASPQVAA